MILIPLFPLEIVVFPREALNLHIFEPRYRDLIRDAERDQVSFGIPYFIQDQPLRYGTLVKLQNISATYPDGRMDIKTKGVKPFEIKRYVKNHPGKSYPGGYVEELYWEEDGDPLKRTSIRNAIDQLYQYMKIPKKPTALDGDFITFEIAHKVGFSKSQEYDFLQIITEVERQDFMLNHLDRMIPMIKEAEEMRKKVQLNGHFKHLTPPEV